VLFFDDFETGNASRWAASSGSWSVVTDGSEAYEQGLTDNHPQFSMVADGCFADQAVEARVKVLDFPGSSTSYYVALFARALGPTTHYFLAFDSTGKLSLRKRVNSSGNGSTRLGSDKALSPRIDDGEWHTLRLEAVGTTLTAYVDGAEELSATDGSIASGSVAVGTLNGTAVFDDVRVTVP
jgi:pectate lyase